MQSQAQGLGFRVRIYGLGLRDIELRDYERRKVKLEVRGCRISLQAMWIQRSLNSKPVSLRSDQGLGFS